MGKETYLVFDMEENTETSFGGVWNTSYDPSQWEEVKIDFTVLPLRKTIRERVSVQKKAKESYPERDRRDGFERRAGYERRMGSNERRCWQDSRRIGASDCRNGHSERRQDLDRRKNPDRRRK